MYSKLSDVLTVLYKFKKNFTWENFDFFINSRKVKTHSSHLKKKTRWPKAGGGPKQDAFPYLNIVILVGL